MYVLVFCSPCQSMTSWFDGSQSCQPQQTWSIWPCLHHQQTMASTSFGRRSDAAKRASKLQKAVLFYGKNSSCSMESAKVSGTWGLRFPRAKNIYKWFQLHHPERMLVCHTESSMCFQHFLWNWYQSWGQMPCQTRVSGSHINQKSCQILSKMLLLYTSCNKNSWIPLLWSYGLVLLPTSKSSSQVFFPEKPTTFSRAGWFPTVITCHSPTFCHANQGPGRPKGGSKSFAAKFG